VGWVGVLEVLFWGGACSSLPSLAPRPFGSLLGLLGFGGGGVCWRVWLEYTLCLGGGVFFGLFFFVGVGGGFFCFGFVLFFFSVFCLCSLLCVRCCCFFFCFFFFFFFFLLVWFFFLRFFFFVFFFIFFLPGLVPRDLRASVGLSA